jgi:hypothetical protein
MNEIITIAITASIANFKYPNKMKIKKVKRFIKKNIVNPNILKYLFLFLDLKKARKMSFPCHNSFLKKRPRVSVNRK